MKRKQGYLAEDERLVEKEQGEGTGISKKSKSGKGLLLNVFQTV